MSKVLLGFLCGALLTLSVQALAEKEMPVARTAGVRSVVLSPGEAVTRVAPSGKARVTILAQGENAFLARLRLASGASVPLHRDASEEYIVVLEGNGIIWIDGVESALGPGSVVFMAANAEVRFQNGGEELVVYQVFAGPGSAKKYDSWVE